MVQPVCLSHPFKKKDTVEGANKKFEGFGGNLFGDIELRKCKYKQIYSGLGGSSMQQFLKSEPGHDVYFKYENS